jgi:hypothetical protein
MLNKTHNIVSIEGKRTGFTESRMVKNRAYERRVQPVHRYGARKATKGPVNLCRFP